MIYSEENNRDHIKEIQRLLYEISFYRDNIPMIIPDGICGPETHEAIGIFQREYGIPVTGNADHETWEKLIEVSRSYCTDILSPDIFRKDTCLVPGNTGTAVHFVQVMLNAIGRKYYNIPPVELTGTYDAPTENSINAFKRAAQGAECSEGINACLWNALVSEFNKTE